MKLGLKFKWNRPGEELGSTTPGKNNRRRDGISSREDSFAGFLKTRGYEDFLHKKSGGERNSDFLSEGAYCIEHSLDITGDRKFRWVYQRSTGREKPWGKKAEKV